MLLMFVLAGWSACFVIRGEGSYRFAWNLWDVKDNGNDASSFTSWPNHIASLISAKKLTAVSSKSSEGLEPWYRQVAIVKRAAAPNATNIAGNNATNHSSPNVTGNATSITTKPKPVNSSANISTKTDTSKGSHNTIAHSFNATAPHTTSPAKDSSKGNKNTGIQDATNATKSPPTPKNSHNTTKHSSETTLSHTILTKRPTKDSSPNTTRHAETNVTKSPASTNKTESPTNSTGKPKSTTDSSKKHSTDVPKKTDNETNLHSTSSTTNTSKMVNVTGKPKIGKNATSVQNDTSKTKDNSTPKSKTKHDEIKGKSSSIAHTKIGITIRAESYPMEKSDEDDGMDFRHQLPSATVIRLPVHLPIESRPTIHINNPDSSGNGGYLSKNPKAHFEGHNPSSSDQSGDSSHYDHGDSSASSFAKGSKPVPIEMHPTIKIYKPDDTSGYPSGGQVVDGSKTSSSSKATASASKDHSQSSGSYFASGSRQVPLEMHPTVKINAPVKTAGQGYPSSGQMKDDSKPSKADTKHYQTGSSKSRLPAEAVPVLHGFKQLAAVGGSSTSTGYGSSGQVKNVGDSRSRGAVFPYDSSPNSKHLASGSSKETSVSHGQDDKKPAVLEYGSSGRVKDKGASKHHEEGVSSSRGSATSGRVKDAEGSRLYVPWDTVVTDNNGGSSHGYATSGQVKDASGSRQYALNSVVIDDGSTAGEEYATRDRIKFPTGGSHYDTSDRLGEAVVVLSRGYDTSGGRLSNDADSLPYGSGSKVEENFSRGSASVGRVNDATGSRVYGSEGKVKEVGKPSNDAYK